MIFLWIQCARLCGAGRLSARGFCVSSSGRCPSNALRGWRSCAGVTSGAVPGERGRVFSAEAQGRRRSRGQIGLSVQFCCTFSLGLGQVDVQFRNSRSPGREERRRLTEPQKYRRLVSGSRQSTTSCCRCCCCYRNMISGLRL